MLSNDQKIQSLITEGAKYYASKDYNKSTDFYSQLNQLYEVLTGSNNPDYLYLYGKSLYQLSLSKSDIFFGSNTISDDEQDVEISEKHDSNLFNFTGKLEEDEDDTRVLEPNNKGENHDENHEQRNVVEPQDNETKEEYDNISEFEFVWEILDLARSLYEKKLKEAYNDDSIKQKLSETYDLLGEVSLECENFSQAKEDFQSCLKLRKELYEKEDSVHRLIIETYYKISLSLEFDPIETESCKENLSQCIKLLKTRIEIGKAEIDDRDLLHELEEKLEGLNNLPILSKDTIMSKLVSNSPTDLQNKINDLTHTVKKRKRSTNDDHFTKKQK